MSGRSFIITLVLTFATAVVFAIWPEIDLHVSGLFFANGTFPGNNGTGRAIRLVFFYLPGVIFVLIAGTWVLGRLGLVQARGWVASSRSLIFLTLAFALAPGLVVNVVLKDHWGRPRPLQVREFQGNAEFKPWWRTDGACQKNCSFVSGEASAAFWLAAPASLAPPQVRAVTMVAAIAIGSVTAAGRVAFGKHFLSDVIFAALFTLLICQMLHTLIIKMGGRRARK